VVLFDGKVVDDHANAQRSVERRVQV
jgi:hypothetical protein